MNGDEEDKEEEEEQEEVKEAQEAAAATTMAVGLRAKEVVKEAEEVN